MLAVGPELMMRPAWPAVAWARWRLDRPAGRGVVVVVLLVRAAATCGKGNLKALRAGCRLDSEAGESCGLWDSQIRLSGAPSRAIRLLCACVACEATVLPSRVTLNEQNLVG